MKTRILLREKYKIDIRYKTKTDITQRTISAAEAFGLGIDDEKEFPIVDNLELDVNENSIIYITGDSGSGKSSILRELERIHGDKCVNLNKLEIDGDKPLIDTVGKTVEEGLELLTRVGLSDAFLFIRRYSQLSDGQKYRYRLAKVIESGKQIWLADEFCSTLDRDTAKIVAFNVQKTARKLGKGLFVATCNTDLAEDLNPSLRIDKRYGSEIQITYAPNESVKECSLVKEMRLEQGERADWKALSQFHYRSHECPPQRKNGIWRIMRGTELCGVVVYSYPPIVTFGRKLAFGKQLRQPELNQILSIISRVVIHPKYRTTGLGQKIIKETLKNPPTQYTETIAVMARYNPFFEKAGMIKIMEKVPEKNLVELTHLLERFGFDARFIASQNYNEKALNQLSEAQIKELKSGFSRHYHPRFGKSIPYLNQGGSAGLKAGPGGGAILVKPAFIKGVMEMDNKTFAHLIGVLGKMVQISVYLIYPLPPQATKDTNVTNITPQEGEPYCETCKEKLEAWQVNAHKKLKHKISYSIERNTSSRIPEGEING